MESGNIHRVLNQVNLFVEIFLIAGEIVRNQEVLTYRLANYETPIVDLRTHYHPPCKEVAVNLLDDSMGADETLFYTIKLGNYSKFTKGRRRKIQLISLHCSNTVN